MSPVPAGTTRGPSLPEPERCARVAFPPELCTCPQFAPAPCPHRVSPLAHAGPPAAVPGCEVARQSLSSEQGADPFCSPKSVPGSPHTQGCPRKAGSGAAGCCGARHQDTICFAHRCPCFPLLCWHLRLPLLLAAPLGLGRARLRGALGGHRERGGALVWGETLLGQRVPSALPSPVLCSSVGKAHLGGAGWWLWPPVFPVCFGGADVWGDLGNVATICDVPGAKEPQRAGSSQRVLWGCSRRQLQGVFRTGTEPGGASQSGHILLGGRGGCWQGPCPRYRALQRVRGAVAEGNALKVWL